MRELNFQKTVFFSAVFHLIALLIAVLVLRQSRHFVPPSPYIVNLVSIDAIQKGTVSKQNSAATPREVEGSLTQTTLVMKSKKETEEERQKIKEKISALEAKERIRKIVELRKVISLKASASGPSEKTNASGSEALRGDIFDNYYRTITQEIWRHWIYPDMHRENKDIEAIISIRILKDGTAVVQRFEKSSGNPLFDRSALKALAKASPLAPPPHEMEIGVRFYP